MEEGSSAYGAIIGENAQIGPYSMVGPGSVVLAGVKIGRNSCIGRNVKVTGDVGDNTYMNKHGVRGKVNNTQILMLFEEECIIRK